MGVNVTVGKRRDYYLAEIHKIVSGKVFTSIFARSNGSKVFGAEIGKHDGG